MRNVDVKQVSLKHSAYATIVCLLACWQCESFQPVAMPLVYRNSIARSETTFALTSLYATKQRTAPSPNGVMKKKNGKKTGTKITRTNTVAENSRKLENPIHVEEVAKSAYVVKDELLGHDLLTADEEKVLGRKIQRAVKLKAAMTQYVEQKRQQLRERHFEEESYMDDLTHDLLLDRRSDFSAEEGEDLEGLSVVNLQRNRLEAFDRRRISTDDGDVDSWDCDRLRQTAYSIVEPDDAVLLGGEDSNLLSVESLLTEEEVVEQFGLAGGRDELAKIIVEGALAKEKMISCNVRLVVSIAKRWCQRSSAKGAAQYTGSWDVPSLDEVVQEGIFGLSTAAERFEPERNLKFGTYAFHWITNSVRGCFNRGRELGLRVPVYFHVYRQKYQAFVMEEYYATGSSVSLEDAAKELDLTPRRLSFILQSTTTPTSIDNSPTSQHPGQAGKAGATDKADESYTVANMLECKEPGLLDQIELSLLRQCLENAMATELSPHERDVLRLRHGLDDGVSRTTREVAEICGGSLSQSDVRTAEQRACRKLRSPYSVHTVQLYEFLDLVGADISTAKTTR